MMKEIKKKNIKHLLFMVACLLVLFGCETESDEWVDVGYKSLRIQMFFQADETKSYTAFYNDQEISMQPGPGNSKLFQVPDTVGVLKVFNNNEPTPELEVTINVGTIYLIQLPGQPVTLYEEEDFMKFTATMSLFEGYKAVINDQEILDGENYIRKDNATGNLEFYGEEETTPVYTIEDVTIEAGQNVVILQASETEFIRLEGGTGEEEPPATDTLSKVNFFYTPTGPFNNVDSIRIVLYTMDWYLASGNIFPVDTIVVEKGKLSPYVELDIAQFRESYGTTANFLYSVYNAETEEQIIDVWTGATMFSINNDGSEINFKCQYKFATYQVAYTVSSWDGSYIYSNKFIMGEPW